MRKAFPFQGVLLQTMGKFGNASELQAATSNFVNSSVFSGWVSWLTRQECWFCLTIQLLDTFQLLPMSICVRFSNGWHIISINARRSIKSVPFTTCAEYNQSVHGTLLPHFATFINIACELPHDIHVWWDTQIHIDGSMHVTKPTTISYHECRDKFQHNCQHFLLCRRGLLNWMDEALCNKKITPVTTQHRSDSRSTSIQCGTALLCTDVSHWLGASLQ